jgi:hypothetical protein
VSQNLWFDVGHTETATAPKGGITNEAVQASKGVQPSSYEIMASPEKIMKQLAALSYNDPAQFIAFQTALASGVFGRVNVTGVWDPDTEAAVGRAMLQYVKLTMGAGVGISFKDYLLNSGQMANALGQAGSQKQQPQVSLTDPAQIRDAAMQAATEALGQGLSEKDLNAFVKAFQSKQFTAQTSTSESVTNPDLSAEAMAYAQTSHPAEYQANQRQAYLGQLVNLLGGGLTRRPDQTPVPAVGK